MVEDVRYFEDNLKVSGAQVEELWIRGLGFKMKRALRKSPELSSTSRD